MDRGATVLILGQWTMRLWKMHTHYLLLESVWTVWQERNISVPWTWIQDIGRPQWPKRTRRKQLSLRDMGCIISPECPLACPTVQQHFKEICTWFLADLFETLENLDTVLQWFEKYGLKLKPRKCQLFIQEAKFLGHLANAEGIQITQEHVLTVQDWPLPKNWKELQQFLGFVNYHRSFVQGMAGMCAPLYELTGQKAEWKWTEKHTQAIERLKGVMTSPPVLGFSNSSDTFILDTNTSDCAIGAALSQLQAGKEQPISYASKALNSKQQQYCTTRKELLAVVVFAQHYEHYLLGRSFIIRTDHVSLTWLMRFKKIGGQLCRWLEYLARFSYAIQHHSGEKHSNADGLSRIPHEVTCDYYESGKEVQSLPCGGCKYCTKMAADWIRYEEVDDILPLWMSHNDLLTPRMPDRSRDAEPGVLEPQGISDPKAEFRDTEIQR